MTNHIVRLYTAAGAIVIFFLLWATIAARPWATTEQVTPQDPRLVALAQREKNLRKRAAGVNRVVARRWAIYERRSTRRQRQNAAALQRHIQELEASQAAAVRTTQKAVAETARARAYAASVVAWANQQLQAASSATTTAPTVASASGTAATARVRARSTPISGRPSGGASTTAPSPKAPEASTPPAAPAAPVSAPVPAPVSAPAAPRAAAPATAPAPVAAPVVAAPPPVQVVTLPPVTTTKPSKK